MKTALKSIFWIFLGILLLCGIGGGYVAFSILPTLPSVTDLELKQKNIDIPLRIYTIDGRLIAEFGDQKRNPITIEETPALLINAILAGEDDRFFEHHGVDFFGVIRALIVNIQSGDIVQGSSTVTMQVAGNYFLDRREKTYTRKLKEVLLAFELERKLSKEKILELYLNKIFLGQRAYGFSAASSVYFNKELDELTLSEIATLAGIPKAPSKINPVINPEAARLRRDYVLGRMRNLAYIDEKEFITAKNSGIKATRHIAPIEVEASYVAEMARSYMVNRYGKAAYTSGYNVYTTIDSENQSAANNALRNGLIAYDQRQGYSGPVGHIKIYEENELSIREILSQYPLVGGLKAATILEVKMESMNVLFASGQKKTMWPLGWKWANLNVIEDLKTGDIIYIKASDSDIHLAQIPEIQGAIVSIDPNDGALLALTGGFDFYSGKFNRATQARRQAGSNIKPFIYSAALDNGFTPATLVSGAPIVVEDSWGDTWRPENYSKKVFGPTRLRQALAQSLNLVSVRLVRGMETALVREHLQQFGFDQKTLPNGLSLALGSADISPWEMVRAYAVFANGGHLIEPYFIARVENQNGEIVEYANRTMLCPDCELNTQPLDSSGNIVLYDPRYSKRVISPENAFLMTELMKGVIQNGTGRRALTLNRDDIAGKTGTTNNFRDAWFSGFNPDVATSIWVGFDQPKNLGARESGARAALPIWIEYMAVALNGKPEKNLEPPENIITAWVDQTTGDAVAVDDPKGYKEFFLMGTEPHALIQGGAPAIDANMSNTMPSLEDLF